VSDTHQAVVRQRFDTDTATTTEETRRQLLANLG